MVIIRSRSLVKFRVDIIAGTEQPTPQSIGTTEHPDKPILRKSLSIINAIRDI
ncbi:hypothetical protein SDC9_158732 [bioreactor metagenome]|uniref:Uncharacterized protein n=1 Tax=bioreactor metagenome TaxID=1076179 RepID=A0A645FAU4_9ZZZZ